MTFFHHVVLLWSVFHQRSTNATIEFYETPVGPGSGILRTTIAATISDSSTGVARFQHQYRPELVTFVFSSGRHEDTGLNSYATVNMTQAVNEENNNNELDPFQGITEKFLDPFASGGAYTWVSAYTEVSTTVVKHHVLFAGGNSRVGEIFPSRLYTIEENLDGSLQPAVLQWSTTPTRPARYAKLVDLGNIPLDPNNPDGELGSVAGTMDIVIAGFAGVDIYSQRPSDGTWSLLRNVAVVGSTSASYVGLDVLYTSDGQSFLVIMNRSEWRMVGTTFDAPCYFYNFRANKLFHPFASEGQTVSVAVLDDNTQLIVGAGGQETIQGQPNLMYRILPTSLEPSCVLADQQLVPDAPTFFQRTEFVESVPTSPDQYASVALAGLTKTRQVIPFRLPGHTKDYILEVNKAQPAYIYCRNQNGETFRIIPLPGSEGTQDVFALAADVMVHDTAVYIVLAMHFAENMVFAVDKKLLLDPSVLTPEPTAMPASSLPTIAPTTNAPSPAPTISVPTLLPTIVVTSSVTTDSLPTTMPTREGLTTSPTQEGATREPTESTFTTRPSEERTVLPSQEEATTAPTESTTSISSILPAEAVPTMAPSQDLLATTAPTEDETTIQVPTQVVPPTTAPILTQKQAPTEPKCGSVASSAGYGGVGGQSKGCDIVRHLRSTKRIRGR